MDRPPDLVLPEELSGSLFERADGPHDAVEIEGGRAIDRHVGACGWSITRMAPSRRSVNVRQASSNRSSGKWCVTRLVTSILPCARSVSARAEDRKSVV